MSLTVDIYFQGDSGGPLICKNENHKKVFVGIHDVGGDRCTKWNVLIHRQPSIFTSVPFYKPWIRSIIEPYGYEIGERTSENRARKNRVCFLLIFLAFSRKI